MTISVLKVYHKKRLPVTKYYRCYKNFNMITFRNNLKYSLETFNANTMTYEDFKEIFMTILNHYAPMKKKVIRGNNAPFMSKRLSKEIMHRSKLKNKLNKNPTEENRNLYRKQRNDCVNLLRKEKRNYFNNLDIKVFEDNKIFWKAIKPLFSDKQNVSQRDIIIEDEGRLISDNAEVAELLNSYFIDAVEGLDIEPFAVSTDNISTDDIENTRIENIIKKFEAHPSILKIKENIAVEKKFVFSDICSKRVDEHISKLDPKKAGIENDIPAMVLIRSSDIVSTYLADIYNMSKNNNIYPSTLKLGTIAPIHKKTVKTLIKKDYRPITLLPVVSKLYERNMHDEISSYMDKFLSPYLFGYRKNHSTEQCLVVMIEIMKKALDFQQSAGAVLTDLSKAFDCLNHDLLIAKLAAYGFEDSALHLIYDYLKGRKQRTKVNNSYSNWKDVKYGVPQGSNLGPLLFNIFTNDLFFFIEKLKIANFADDNTPYTVEKNNTLLLKTLEEETNEILKWFHLNEMKTNNDKCHLLIAKNDNGAITLGNEVIEAEDSVELLGLKIDKDLTFNDYVLFRIKKANQKLHALARVSKFMTQEKLKIVMKTFIMSQFNYCSLVWMFHSRTLNTKINKLHERALRLAYKNDSLSFQELLELDNSFTVHERNIQKLATEMYKVKNHLSPLPMQNLFSEQTTSYELRSERCWEVPRVRTVNNGTETIRFRGLKTWEMVPNEIKGSTTLIEFKNRIKKWKPTNCTCRLCKTYIAGVGFID
jgi:DNA-binding protein